MSLARSIAQLGGETIIYGLAGTLTRFIGVFLVPLYTRVFTPADYGIMAVIGSFFGIFSTLIVLGLDNSSARWFYDSTAPDDRKTIISSWFWCQLAVSMFIALIILLNAKRIAGLLALTSEHTSLIILAGLAVPLSTFPKVLGNLLRYQRRPWATTIFSLGTSLGTTLIIILFVLIWHQGLEGLFSAQLLGAVATTILAVLLLSNWVAPRHFSVDVLKPMLLFGLPLIPAALASWVTASSDRLILQAFSTMEEVGLYSIASSVASIVALGTGAFQMAWGPFAYSIHKEADASAVYSKVLTVYVWLGCWACTTVSLFAAVVLRIFTTPSYYAAASSVSFLSFSYLAVGAYYIVSIGCGIAKKSTPVSASIFMGAAVNTLLNFALIPHLGRNGAAIATLVAYVTAAVYLFLQSQKHYRIAYKLKPVWGCALASGGLIIVSNLVFFDMSWKSHIGNICLCMVFIPLGYSLRIYSTDDLRRAIAIVAGHTQRFFCGGIAR